jgi:hypothetical protein
LNFHFEMKIGNETTLRVSVVLYTKGDPMSRGPGWVERALDALLRDARPNETFTASEIARRVYGYLETVERWHTISVRRAFINVYKKNPDWPWRSSTRRNRDLGHGSERVLYHRLSPQAHNFEVHRWRRAAGAMAPQAEEPASGEGISAGKGDSPGVTCLAK